MTLKPLSVLIWRVINYSCNCADIVFSSLALFSPFFKKDKKLQDFIYIDLTHCRLLPCCITQELKSSMLFTLEKFALQGSVFGMIQNLLKSYYLELEQWTRQLLTCTSLFMLTIL